MFNYLLPERLKTALCGLLKRCGPSLLRARIWNKEFDSGRWDYLDATKDDYIYGYLQNYAAGGKILDMGCGSGNTGTELAYDSYSAYDGVDISTSAVHRAVKRSEMEGRQRKNRYFIGDMLTFTTDEMYDVILFRESMHYFSTRKVVKILDRYKTHLTDTGVLIVRLCDRLRYWEILTVIRKRFRVLAEHPHPTTKAIIVIFR